MIDRSRWREELQARFSRVTLERIEAEMKRIGFWSENPPPLLEMANRGELRSYLDAPSFEQWLQCVFLARARAAVRNDTLPSSSSVAEMARRHYDYHSYMPEAQPLLALLALSTSWSISGPSESGHRDR